MAVRKTNGQRRSLGSPKTKLLLTDKQNHWPLKWETRQRQISGRESMGKIEEIIEPHEKQIIRPKIQLVNMKPCI